MYILCIVYQNTNITRGSFPPIHTVYRPCRLHVMLTFFLEWMGALKRAQREEIKERGRSEKKGRSKESFSVRICICFSVRICICFWLEESENIGWKVLPRRTSSSLLQRQRHNEIGLIALSVKLIADAVKSRILARMMSPIVFQHLVGRFQGLLRVIADRKRGHLNGFMSMHAKLMNRHRHRIPWIERHP